MEYLVTLTTNLRLVETNELLTAGTKLVCTRHFDYSKNEAFWSVCNSNLKFSVFGTKCEIL